MLDGINQSVAQAAAANEAARAPQMTTVIGSQKVTASRATGAVAKVYFSPVIDASNLIKLYELVNEGIYGKVAIKVHTGEPNAPNILPRQMVSALQKTIPDSAIVETNTLYEGGPIYHPGPQENAGGQRREVLPSGHP